MSVMPGHITSLTISEIERLAKAGVKIELAAILPQSDQFSASPPDVFTTKKKSMADAIWDRWNRSRMARRDPSLQEEYLERPYQLLASQHGDKVVVSVHPHNFNYDPFMIEDVAAIFPSDALMAQLALWEQHHK